MKYRIVKTGTVTKSGNGTFYVEEGHPHPLRADPSAGSGDMLWTRVGSWYPTFESAKLAVEMLIEGIYAQRSEVVAEFEV